MADSNPEKGVKKGASLDGGARRSGSISILDSVYYSADGQKRDLFVRDPTTQIETIPGTTFQRDSDKQHDDLRLEAPEQSARELEVENKLLKAQVAELQADKDAAHSALDELQDRLECATSKLQNAQQSLVAKTPIQVDEESISQQTETERILQRCAELEIDMDALKLKSEDDLKTEREASQRLLEAQRSLSEQALLQIQSLHVQLQTAHNAPPTVQIDDSNFIERLKVSHAGELNEQYRLVDFFKNNSERVAKEARESKAKNTALTESLEEMDRELAGRMSHILALEAQLEEVGLPKGTSKV